MCAMAEVVGGIRSPRDEALAVNDAQTVGSGERVVPIQIPDRIDTAIDYCHSDPGTVQVQLLPCPRRVHSFGSVVELGCSLHGAIGSYIGHIRILSELSKSLGWQRGENRSANRG